MAEQADHAHVRSRACSHTAVENRQTGKFTHRTRPPLLGGCIGTAARAQPATRRRPPPQSTACAWFSDRTVFARSEPPDDVADAMSYVIAQLRALSPLRSNVTLPVAASTASCTTPRFAQASAPASDWPKLSAASSSGRFATRASACTGGRKPAERGTTFSCPSSPFVAGS